MIKWLRLQWSTHTPETAFLLLSIIFGLAFLVLTPPTQAADETTHFYRAFQLSDGHIFSKSSEHGFGDFLPSQVTNITKQLYGDIPSHYERRFHYRQLPHLLFQRFNVGDRTFVHLEGAAVYSPIGYIPQIIALWVARLIFPSVVLMYYLGRLANLAVWILLMYLAIRFWPSNKWALFALALIPMSLSQAATYSPDALINSLGFFLISFTLYLACRSKKIPPLYLGILATGTILLSLCKPIFFVLGLMSLLFAQRQFGSRTKRWLFISVIVGGSLLVTLVWNAKVAKYSAGIQYYYYPKMDIDEPRQLVNILTHPFGFIHTLSMSYFSSLGDVVARTYIGRLGWWDIDMPIWFLVTNYTLLTLAVVNRDPTTPKLRRKPKVFAAAIFALGVLAISTVLYMTISIVHARTIEGIQGRYFIALTPLLAIAFGGLLTVKDWNKISAKLFPISYALLLSISLFIMVNRFI